MYRELFYDFLNSITLNEVISMTTYILLFLFLYPVPSKIKDVFVFKQAFIISLAIYVEKNTMVVVLKHFEIFLNQGWQTYATSHFWSFYAMAKNGIAQKIFYATSGIKWPKMHWLLFHRLTCRKRMFHVFGIVYVTLPCLSAVN